MTFSNFMSNIEFDMEVRKSWVFEFPTFLFFSDFPSFLEPFSGLTVRMSPLLREPLSGLGKEGVGSEAGSQFQRPRLMRTSVHPPRNKQPMFPTRPWFDLKMALKGGFGVPGFYHIFKNGVFLNLIAIRCNIRTRRLFSKCDRAKTAKLSQHMQQIAISSTTNAT